MDAGPWKIAHKGHGNCTERALAPQWLWYGPLQPPAGLLPSYTLSLLTKTEGSGFDLNCLGLQAV